MTEINHALTLRQEHNNVAINERRMPLGSSIARDVYRVFGEKRLLLPGWRTQMLLKGEGSDIRPPYDVLTTHYPDDAFPKLHIYFGDLTDFGQAAARTVWAVYEQKRGTPMHTNGKLYIKDVQADGNTYLKHGLIYPDLDPQRRKLDNIRDPFDHKLTWRYRVGSLALPTMLEELQDRRQLMYGEAADSMAVMAMVGSRVTLPEFTSAWNEAMAQDTPVQSARYLLDSGIFVPQQSPESDF